MLVELVVKIKTQKTDKFLEIVMTNLRDHYLMIDLNFKEQNQVTDVMESFQHQHWLNMIIILIWRLYLKH